MKNQGENKKRFSEEEKKNAPFVYLLTFLWVIKAFNIILWFIWKDNPKVQVPTFSFSAAAPYPRVEPIILSSKTNTAKSTQLQHLIKRK